MFLCLLQFLLQKKKNFYPHVTLLGLVWHTGLPETYTQHIYGDTKIYSKKSRHYRTLNDSSVLVAGKIWPHTKSRNIAKDLRTVTMN